MIGERVPGGSRTVELRPVAWPRLAEALAAARTPRDIARALHVDGLAWLGGDGLALYRVSSDRRGLELVRPPSDVHERVPSAVWIPLAGPAPMCEAVRTGVPARLGGRLYLPLRGDGGDVIGGLTLIGAGAHERRGALGLVDLCGRALARTIEHEADQLARLAAEASAARLADELARRDRSLAMVVHDLRSPLAAIVVSAQMLAERPDAVGSVARIGRSADRMQRMIDQLLDFARLRHHAPLTLEPRPIDLADVLTDVVEEARLAFPRARIELAGAHVAGVRGEWDGERVAEAVANLIANAVEHGDPCAPVRVRLSGDPGDAERVSLEVENQGPPIPPEALAGIFEPFQQPAVPGRPRRRRGLGLGLYITHALVAAHGGAVEVRSSEAGTCFRVTLPRRASPGGDRA